MSCFHPRDLVINKPRLVYQWSKLPNGKMIREKKPLGVTQKYTIQVPCGKCPACLALQQAQWSFRIEQEALYGGHSSVLFVTFTYDNEHLPEDLCVSKSEVQRYLHDLRQNLERHSEFAPKVRYYFCAEYGSKFGRPHYHAILFFSHSVDWKIIQSSWNKGIVDIRSFTSARAGYVAKYTVKDINLDYAGRTAPFHLQSQGLGKCFLDMHNSFDSLNFNTYYRNLSGRKVKLPRYYIDKLGTTRSYTQIKNLDGSISKRSHSYHSFGYYYSNEYAFNRYLEKESIEMAKFGNTADSYYLYQRERAVKLEHELIQNNFNRSSYYVRTRFESSVGAQ